MSQNSFSSTIQSLDDMQLFRLYDAVSDELALRQSKYEAIAGTFDGDIDEIAWNLINDEDIFGRELSSDNLYVIHEIAPGIIAIPGMIADRNTSGTMHECVLATVRSKPIDPQDSWAWDPDDGKAPYFLTAATHKIGGLRRSISLYKVFQGMVVVFHHRMLKNGLHKKIRDYALRVSINDEGHAVVEQLRTGFLQNLPAPKESDEL